MASINTAPLGGTRDFLGLAVLRRRYAIEIIERVYQRFGFEPLETPTMERLETLLGKYGEEGDQLLFRVLKRGESLQRALGADPTQNTLAEEGLRYDLTVPLARVVAAYRSQLPRVFKRYQIQPVFRADRPARGRFREFYQCDVDIVGSRSQVAEAEVIVALATVLRELGFAPSDFAVRLNHRQILRALMDVSGIPVEQEGTALVAVDKLDKIGLDGVREELIKRGIAPDAAEALLSRLDANAALHGPGELAGEPKADNIELLRWLGDDVFAAHSAGQGAVAELRRVVQCVAAESDAVQLRVDPYLARGLSYYTGPIFEIEFPSLGVSGGGGGRYDGLVGMFSGQQIPACGFSLGLERILLLMEERTLFPERLLGQPQVLVTQSGEDGLDATLALAARLRQAGFRVDLYPDLDRYGPQFAYAEKRGIRWALLQGANERERGVIAVKDLESGDQQDVPWSDLVSWLQQRL